MEDWEEDIWKQLGEENLAVQQVGLDSSGNGQPHRGMGLEGERKSREGSGKISKIDVGVEGRTPDYMVREELQREKMKSRAVRRAWGFEKLTGGGGGSTLALRCLEELKERVLKEGFGMGEGEKGIF